MTLVLASGSPRRRELLSRFNLPFRVAPSLAEERPPQPGEDAAAYALALARDKVEEVAGRFPSAVVLGADTVVEIGGQMLGKPVDQDDAARMLSLLRGRTHTVVTAVAVQCGPQYAGSVAAEVCMRNFADEERDQYVASGEPMDKAGAYAVQGLGGRLVDRVKGCRETVIGLPLCLSYDLLSRCGVVGELPPGARCVHSV